MIGLTFQYQSWKISHQEKKVLFIKLSDSDSVFVIDDIIYFPILILAIGTTEDEMQLAILVEASER